MDSGGEEVEEEMDIRNVAVDYRGGEGMEKLGWTAASRKKSNVCSQKNVLFSS